MAAPIALQLYTVRDALAQDFEGTVRRVADIGYAGVEPFGLPDNYEAAAALYADLGLRITSAHMPIPLGENQAQALAIAKAYGLQRVILSSLDRWQSADEVKASCARYNQAAQVLADHGFEFGLHNHFWEFAMIDGRTGFDLMRDHLDESIFFEVDTYWVQVGGQDAAALVRDLGARAPLLHIKDGPADNRDSDMVAVGAGAMDVPGIIKAGAGATEWLIVELDRCATDMMKAVEDSYAYLVNEGLGHGR